MAAKGRPKKELALPVINSYLTLQVALKPEFAKRDLPELSVSHNNKAIYLSGPCGKQLCKVFFTGTTKLSASDFPIIFTQVTDFLDKHLTTLTILFILKKQLKEPNPPGVSFTNNTQAGLGVYFNSKHPDYHKNILYTYKNHIVFSGNCISDEDFESPNLKAAIKAQRAHLASYVNKNEIQAEVNKIIADLSNCSI